MQSHINVDLVSSSSTLLGVQAFQRVSSRVAGIGICSCTSSFDSTMSGWRGTRPALQKAEQILPFVNDYIKAA
jgi:hypothetical protein